VKTQKTLHTLTNNFLVEKMGQCNDRRAICVILGYFP
jgi:hypothetical protein